MSWTPPRFRLTEVPERVAIIGGGYIGLEFATFFSEIGAEVVVFEMPAQDRQRLRRRRRPTGCCSR